MRKLLLLSLIAILYSCSQTVEDRISDEFKEFVNLNFDNPDDLKEIVAIEFKDSFNNASLYEIVRLSYKLDSLNEVSYALGTNFIVELTNELKAYETKYRNLSSYKREKLLEMIYEYVPLEDKRRYKTYKYNKDFIDSIYSSLDTFAVKTYNIRIRIQEDGKLKISDYYCIIEDDNLKFYNQVPAITELTQKCKSFMKILDEYDQETEEHISMITQRLDKRQEIIDYVKSLGFIINL